MSWRDELKAEIGDLQTAIRVDAGITKDSPPMIVMGTPKHLAELCALILELIDHIPEEKKIGEFCIKCGHQLIWEGQKQLRCVNPDCMDFNKPLIGDHIPENTEEPK